MRAPAAALAIATSVAWAGGCLAEPHLSTANAPADPSDAADDDSSLSAVDSSVEGSPTADAPVDDPAHATCIALCPAGGTCDGATCVLACPGLASCTKGVTCPPGIPCRITCTGPKSCGTVDCGTASTCQVTCDGESACAKVRSSAGQTDITCTGKSACVDTRCSGTTCTVQCNGDACKPADVVCCATTQCLVNGLPGRCP